MTAVARIRESVSEVEIPVSRYNGQNTFGNHSALPMSQSRELVNWDLYKDDDGDFLKSRRGTGFHKPSAGATKHSSSNMKNAVLWDLGSVEYLITQEGADFYYQDVTTPGNPVLIQTAVNGSFVVASQTQAEMFLAADRIFIFHSGGNKIIEWDAAGAEFVGRSLGMNYPYIASIASSGAGVITGDYTVGLELVYRVSGADRLVSSANRMTTGRILASLSALSAEKILLTVQAAELDNDSLWTHLRVWRSKSKAPVLTDPLNPIDAQGLDAELYEEALITKAEMSAASLTAIATGSTLPQGNAGVTAGKPASVYSIELNNADSVMFNLIGIERIELSPLPAALAGVYHGGKIFVSNTNSALLDDNSRNNIYFARFGGTKYSELYNPNDYIDTGRDGKAVVKLISYEKELLVLKDSQTGRVPGGNVDAAYEVLDYRTGITDKNAAKYLPGFGIAAVVSERNDFKMMGPDLVWRSAIGDLEISRPIHNDVFTPLASIDFAYFNGKLFFFYPDTRAFVLHHKEGKGWTRYDYLMLGAGKAFVYGSGLQLGYVQTSAYLLELETNADTDVSADLDSTGNIIPLSETTAMFQTRGGKNAISFERLSVVGQFSSALTAVPFVNGLDWPEGDGTNTKFNFTPDPVDLPDAYMRETEYLLYLSPQTRGGVAYCPLVGRYLNFKLTTNAPAIMRGKSLAAVDDGLVSPAFDPFQNLPLAFPDWWSQLKSTDVWYYTLSANSRPWYLVFGNPFTSGGLLTISEDDYIFRIPLKVGYVLKFALTSTQIIADQQFIFQIFEATNAAFPSVKFNDAAGKFKAIGGVYNDPVSGTFGTWDGNLLNGNSFTMAVYVKTGYLAAKIYDGTTTVASGFIAISGGTPTIPVLVNNNNTTPAKQEFTIGPITVYKGQTDAGVDTLYAMNPGDL